VADVAELEAPASESPKLRLVKPSPKPAAPEVPSFDDPSLRFIWWRDQPWASNRSRLFAVNEDKTLSPSPFDVFMTMSEGEVISKEEALASFPASVNP
jgi:hypothetical protein